MWLTQKRQNELYDALVARARQRLQRVLEPRSQASKLYPHLPTSNNSKPVEGKFQGWAHLSQQKEK